MLGQDRNSLRRAYTEAWQRYRNGLPLEMQQQRIVDVLLLHPEYQDFVLSPDAVAQEFDGSDGRENPYLHMGLHLAVREQLATGLPPEAVQAYARLAKRLGSEHAAEHRLIDCLALELWQAQRASRAPEMEAYREALRGL